MKHLNGHIRPRLRDKQTIPLDAEEIVIELGHGRQISIRRDDIGGGDGLSLYCGIDRKNQTANAQFVIRAQNFGWIQLNVEQAKD